MCSENVKKLDWYESSLIKTSIEWDGFNLYVHCNFKVVCKKAVLEAREEFKKVCNLAYYEGLDRVYTYTKNIKAARLLDKNLEIVGEAPFNGEKYMVVKWEL